MRDLARRGGWRRGQKHFARREERDCGEGKTAPHKKICGGEGSKVKETVSASVIIGEFSLRKNLVLFHGEKPGRGKKNNDRTLAAERSRAVISEKDGRGSEDEAMFILGKKVEGKGGLIKKLDCAQELTMGAKLRSARWRIQ